jgi:hypothetical protein
VPMVKVPAPPRFAHGELVDKVRQLARSFKSVYEKRLRKQCWAFGRSHSLFDIQSSRYYLDLADCAQALDVYDIAPTAWCAFSFDVWHGFISTRTRGKPPPLGWVLNGVRADERLEWFRAELPRYDGGQVWVGSYHRKLLTDWERMREELLDARFKLLMAGDVVQIVVRYFRNDDYAYRVRMAKREAEETIKMLGERVADGCCLW